MATESSPTVTLAGMLLLACVCLILGSFVFVGWQGYTYLEQGTWPGRSVIDLLKMAEVKELWLYYPTSWKGVWKILNRFPASLAIFLGGFALGWLSLKADDAARRERYRLARLAAGLNPDQ